MKPYLYPAEVGYGDAMKRVMNRTKTNAAITIAISFESVTSTLV